jgi:CHAT domain-containing protein
MSRGVTCRSRFVALRRRAGGAASPWPRALPPCLRRAVVASGLAVLPAAVCADGDALQTGRAAALRGDWVEAATQFERASRALPGTEVEIRAIRALLPRGTVHLGEGASEERLQQLDGSGELRRYRFLHFAVQGNLSTQDPALSSLVLSQRHVAPGTDGDVTAAEWAGYGLRGDLTVLSACETGLGQSLAGEGVMSCRSRCSWPATSTRC